MFPGAFYLLVVPETPPGTAPAVACPAVHYRAPEDRPKYQIVQSIRTLSLLPEPHPGKQTGRRLHFRTPSELTTACRGHPEWLDHTREIAERCAFEFPFGTP